MAKLSTNLPWTQANSIWAAQLNPVLSNPLVNGQLIGPVQLSVGANSIPVSLGQSVTGWVVTDMDGIATIYRSQPLNNKTLTLTSSAAVQVSLWVF